jgi:hypothetical protein
MLLDVANFTASEACLDRGLHDDGSDGGIGTGLADLSNIGTDVIGAGGSVEVEAGEKVLRGGAKGFCTTSKGVPLLVSKHMGAMLVVVLVCTVTSTVVEAVKAGGMLPRVRLGVECWLGVGAFKREGSANEGVSSNRLGSELVEDLVLTTI